MRRPERAAPKIVERVVTEHEIRPKFRFLLSDEAKAEGAQMVRSFNGYTLSRSARDTRCQFESIVRSIQDGSYPNIAAADKLMNGVLVQSLETIASGLRQPEWMLWRQSWANNLADGRPDLMAFSARRMMTVDPRYSTDIIDDENEALPKTIEQTVKVAGGRKDWNAPFLSQVRRRYRDLIEWLRDYADGDRNLRVFDDPKSMEVYSLHLSLKPGPDGGAALVMLRKGCTMPEKTGATYKIDATVSAASLADVLSSDSMMSLAREILAPGHTDSGKILSFGEGLKAVDKIPYSDAHPSVPAKRAICKPPALDAELWSRIPREQREDYLKRAARGILRGIHPDETAEELLAGRSEEQSRLQRYARKMIGEIERLTREKFACEDRIWSTEDELHTALREHFRACGYQETLSIRRLKLGDYAFA